MCTRYPGNFFLVWGTLAADKLSYRWPKRTGEPDSTERYEEAYRTRVQVGKTTKTVVIGLTNRKAAGKNDRRRAIVFFGEPPAIYPIVEAAGANDFDTSGQLASAIKLPDGKYLKPGAPVPSEYAGMPLDLYTRIVQGPNAVNSMAVVVTVHHRDEMLRLLTLHALIRAKWKGSLPPPGIEGRAACNGLPPRPRPPRTPPMPLSKQAQVLYTAILGHRSGNPGQVVTYKQLEIATGIDAITQRFPAAGDLSGV